jgi:hypothetical protein
MRTDTRPPLLASKLPAWRLNIRPGHKTLFICPECETVPTVDRRQIAPHRHPTAGRARTAADTS